MRNNQLIQENYGLPITIQPTKTPPLLIFSALTFFGLTMSILSIVTLSNISSPDFKLNLPKALLPGSRFPQALCARPTPNVGNSDLTCQIIYEGMTVTVVYDDLTRNILQSVISTPEYTIGDLFVAWGVPSGFAQYDHGVDVYWGARHAYLLTCSFQPSSHVEFIDYSLKDAQAEHWHGFTSGKGYECSGRTLSH